VPAARGNAARILQAAEAYREQTVAEATGQASRFLQVYEQYKKAPDITRQRLYIETMERILSGSDKIILDGQNSASGVVPVLPLNDLMPQQLQHPPAQGPKAATTGGGSQ
jgi:modulator of FtsH protease HflK